MRTSLRGRALGAVLGLALLGGACVPPAPHPVPTDVPVAKRRFPDATLESLADGRARYVSKCGGCHQLYEPERHAPDAWPRTLDSMSARAKLTEEDRARIEQYLVTLARR